MRTAYDVFIEGRERAARIGVDESAAVIVYQRDEETYRLPFAGAFITRLVADIHAGVRISFPFEVPDE